ncbi:MAG: ankyrin repeat domain-containing protein, partial [Gammaproteobacteria bacterium]|nr:ankyrin repeat domain-containing protein [Gammaproteobacteria bacterium]
MKLFLVTVTCLFLSVPAWGGLQHSLQEIENLIRLRDYSEAVRLLQPLVKEGYPEAQYRMASLYRIGKGVARNLDKATDLYRKSARTGHADAQYALAQLIEKSDDSSASRSEARRWYEQSAAQGHRLAAAKLEQWGKSSGAADLQISRAGVFDAIQHNDAALIDTLVSKGYDLNLSDSQGNTTVMAALLAGWPRLARTLIANSSQLDQANSQGTRPLHMASTRNYQGIVRILLNANVGVDEPDSRGETALMLAVKNENIEIARMLLDKGAKYDLINNKQKSAVDFAYAGDNPKGRALFASYGIKPRAVVKTQTIVSLDEFKAKVKRQGARYAGWPSLNIAIELGESSISSQIIAQKPDLGATDPDGNSALHVAARKGDAG